MLELANAEKGRLDEQLSLVEKRRGDLESSHNTASREQAKLNRRLVLGFLSFISRGLSIQYTDY